MQFSEFGNQYLVSCLAASFDFLLFEVISICFLPFFPSEVRRVFKFSSAAGHRGHPLRLRSPTKSSTPTHQLRWGDPVVPETVRYSEAFCKEGKKKHHSLKSRSHVIPCHNWWLPFTGQWNRSTKKLLWVLGGWFCWCCEDHSSYEGCRTIDSTLGGYGSMVKNQALKNPRKAGKQHRKKKSSNPSFWDLIIWLCDLFFFKKKFPQLKSGWPSKDWFRSSVVCEFGRRDGRKSLLGVVCLCLVDENHEIKINQMNLL